MSEPSRDLQPDVTAGSPRIRVLIVDDQALMRSGFRMILDAQTDIEVVGEARDGEEAVAQAHRLRPDVVLMDIRMPTLDGIQATRRILGDGAPPRVLVLTMFDLDEYVYAALQEGASGFLLKDVSPEQLVMGIRLAANGDQLLAPSITRRLIERYVKSGPPLVSASSTSPSRLTPREREVIQQLARGLSNSEIAGFLGVSDATIKTHVANILDKLGLQDRVQVVIYAYEHRLVEPEATQNAGA